MTQEQTKSLVSLGAATVVSGLVVATINYTVVNSLHGMVTEMTTTSSEDVSTTTAEVEKCTDIKEIFERRECYRAKRRAQQESRIQVRQEFRSSSRDERRTLREEQKTERTDYRAECKTGVEDMEGAEKRKAYVQCLKDGKEMRKTEIQNRQELLKSQKEGYSGIKQDQRQERIQERKAAAGEVNRGALDRRQVLRQRLQQRTPNAETGVNNIRTRMFNSPTTRPRIQFHRVMPTGTSIVAPAEPVEDATIEPMM